LRRKIAVAFCRFIFYRLFTRVLDIVGNLLPRPLHILLLAVARMRVVPQARLILHELHRASELAYLWPAKNYITFVSEKSAKTKKK